MTAANEYAVDITTALNEAADTLTLLASESGLPEGDALAIVHAIIADSERAGQEAKHRFDVDGSAAVGDMVNIAYEFAMSAAGRLLDVLAESNEKLLLGTVARAYTYYLTAAAAAVAYAHATRDQRPDYAYFKFLEEGWHDK